MLGNDDEVMFILLECTYCLYSSRPNLYLLCILRILRRSRIQINGSRMVEAIKNLAIPLLRSSLTASFLVVVMLCLFPLSPQLVHPHLEIQLRVVLLSYTALALPETQML